MFGWIHLFGDNEIAVRLPALIFGLSSIGVLFLLTKRWFSHNTAILASVLMSLSPVHIWFSQENKNNMLLMLFTLLSVYALQRAWEKNNSKRWSVFVSLCILSLYTNIFALWIITSLFLWIWYKIISGSYEHYFKNALRSTFFVGFFYLPQLISTLFQIGSLGRGYLRPFNPGELYKMFLIYLSHGNTIRTVSPYSDFALLFKQSWFYFILELFFALIVLYGLSVIYKTSKTYRIDMDDNKKSHKSINLLLFYFLIPPILLMTASLFYKQIYIERSMIIMLPPFLMILSHGALSLPWKKISVAMVMSLLLINTFALYNLWIVKSDEWTVYKQNPDWKSVTEYFHSEIGKVEGPFVIAQTSPSDVMQYYHKRYKTKGDKNSEFAQLKKLPVIHMRSFNKRLINQAVSENKNQLLYFIHNTYWSGKFKTINKAIVGTQDYRLIEKKIFKGINIYKYILR